jgi:heme/copper-type cytochrome/quinol oxidase subunit 1
LSAAEPGKANVLLTLAWFAAGALLLLADGAASKVSGVDTYYVAVHRSWSLSLPAAFGLFGALYLGMTPRFPVRLRPALGWAHLAIMSAGAVLIEAPGLALSWVGTSERSEEIAGAFQTWNRVAALGYVLLLGGLLLFVWALVDGLRRRPSGSS